MRPTLADYMRNNALKMESAELAPVTEIVAPVTIPDGVEERSRDHLILLPSPGVASSVQVGLGEGDAFEPLTEEQIGVSTVDGDATTASAIVVRDRKLAGELRIRYAPVNVAMEDGDKPFVQLGTVVEPGSENKNPYPANAPTEEAAPQVTNQPTIERDRGEMEDKAKIAENAVDQSVAPKVNVTVVEKGAETRQQDNNKVVDANDGNTGERKAEEVAKETELKGPKEEEETEDNAVNTNGEDPAKASAAVEQEQKNDDAAASTENGNDEGSEENTDAAEAEEEEEEELKQEGYDLTVLIDEAASPLVMEDAEAKTGIVTRVFEGLKKFINRIILWFKNTVLGGARKKRRKSAAEAAERLVQSLAKAKELRKEAIAEVERTYTVGIAKLSEYSKVMTMLAELATDGQKELEKISTDVFMQGTKGGVDTYLKQLEAWGKKYHTKDLFGPEFSSGMVTDSEKLEEEIRKAFKGDQASGLDRTKLDKAAKEIRDVLKPYTAKLNQFNGVSSITQQARASVIADNADTAEVRKVARYLTIAYNYVSAGIKIAQIMEDAMKNFVMAAKNTLAREIGKSDDVALESFTDSELEQGSLNIISDIKAMATPLVMEDANESSNILIRLWEKLLAQMTKIRTYITEKIFGKAASEARDQRIEEADVIVTVWKDMPEEVKENLTESNSFVFSAGVRDMSKYAANADKYMSILTNMRDEASKLAKAALAAMMNDGSNAEGEIQKHVDACVALLKKYNIATLFPSTGDEEDDAFARVFETVDKQIAPFHVEIKDFTDEDVRKGVVDCREYLKHVRAKLGTGYHGVGSDILDAKAGAKRFAKSNSAEIRTLIGVINELWMYVHGVSKMVSHTEVAAKRFIRDVGSKLRSEGKAPILDENQEQEEELTQLSFQIEADLNVDSTGYVAEDADKKGFFARAWENLVKFINKVKTWLNDKVFSKFGKKKREAELEQAKKLAAAMKAARDLRKESLDNLTKRYTAGIRDLKKYSVLMTQLSTLATEALPEADNLAKEGFMALNGNSGSVEKVDAVNVKFAAWEKKYNISAVFGDGDSAEAKCAALNKELRATFQSESGGSLDMTKLKAAAAEIQSVLLPYTEKLDHSQVGSTTSLKSTLAVSSAMNSGVTAEHARLLLKNISGSLAYIIGALTAAQIIETAMKNFVMAALDAIMRNGDDLKTEGFSQPVEIMSAPSDVAPIVIPADKPFLPESLVVTRVTNEDQLVILREDKVRVRTNEAGLGEAIVVVDPALQGQIQANYEAVVSGELPAMESDEDPVVTLDVITDDRDGVEIRVAQMVDGDTEEAIPEELVELRAEGAIALEAHENCIKGLSSMAYMVDMANSIQFEGDVQAAELVMEGMLDSIKGAMTRLGNWLDKSMKYQKVWDINWNQALAGVQKQIRNARSGTAKADVVKLNRVVRNLTINGAPVTDFRELQRQLTEIAKLGNDAKAHMVAVGNLYEDVRRLIAKHDNVNPDGAAILKEIPALVKKVNLRPWASLVKGERQVSEKSVERVPTSAPFLGDVVVAERQSLNDLTYANPDKALRAMLEKTYVGYRTDWELDRDLTSAEMSVLSPQDMEALLNSLRKASEAWDLYSTIVATGKKMDAFYRSLWSLKQYDRDFLSAYGVIIAADQWAYHPVLDLRFDLAYPMQAVLRLININCAVYK